MHNVATARIVSAEADAERAHITAVWRNGYDVQIFCGRRMINGVIRRVMRPRFLPAVQRVLEHRFVRDP